MADHKMSDNIAREPGDPKEWLNHPPFRQTPDGPKDIGRELVAGVDNVDRFENFILGAGENKIEVVVDTRENRPSLAKSDNLADSAIKACQTPVGSISTRKITHWAICFDPNS